MIDASAVCVGVDLGTSGCRAVALDRNEHIVAHASTPLPEQVREESGISQQPEYWWLAVKSVLSDLSRRLRGRRVERIAVNGTSGTLVACDKTGEPLLPALMYNDQRPARYAARIADMAPANCAAHGSSSSLAKYLWYADQLGRRLFRVLHQSDWIMGKLTGRWGVSDYNNCLKLGYDAERLCWPRWMTDSGFDLSAFPEVLPPGERVAGIDKRVAADCGLSATALVMAGTTDSIAAFIAAGAEKVGDGVTSLGSTLVIKLLSDRPVFAPEYGVYSHRLGRRWLAGGASNTGGAVLKQFFSTQDMDKMTPKLRPEKDTGLNYYPLPQPGERFPLNDPVKLPDLQPEAATPIQKFQAILEGIARIESAGYQKLAELGAPEVRAIRTAGGGAANTRWTDIRRRYLGKSVVMSPARFTDAAAGAALLALKGVEHD